MKDAQTLAIDLIRLDGDTQPRAGINEETVTDYATVWQANPVEYPFDKPCEVFHDGTTYWCADGFHRILGGQRAKRASVQCRIHKGTARDAFLFAAKCNSQHGLRRTKADKRHVVTRFLNDKEWKEKSNRWISEVCDVSHTFVAEVRLELEPKVSVGNVANSHPKQGGDNGEKKRGKDGKQYKATKPATTKKSEPTVAEQIAQSEEVPEEIKELTTEQKCEADNKEIESFCRELTKFFDDKLPGVVWIDSQGRVGSARSALKSCCNTLRQSKSTLCPKCEDGQTKKGECSYCKGYGYLPKLMADALGGEA